MDMRKVKGAIEMVAIISLVFALLIAILFYVFFFQPLVSGPARSLESSQYCSVTKTKSLDGPHGTRIMTLKLDRIYNAKKIVLYITPGGLVAGPLSAVPHKIDVEIFDGNKWHSIGGLRNLGKEQSGTKNPCMGLRTSVWKDIDHCREYKGPVQKIRATAEDHSGCSVTSFFGGIVSAILQEEFTTYCSVYKIKAQIYYPCNLESTLVYGNCSSGSNGVGFNHQYPLDCDSVDTNYSKVTPCTMNDGEYYYDGIVKYVRQMPFSGNPIVQLGARAGCAGVQTGCDIKFYLAKPVAGSCKAVPPHVYLAGQVGTIENIDYEYIYTDPVSVSDYVDIDEESPTYQKWCLKVISDGCKINSIDVQRYIR